MDPIAVNASSSANLSPAHKPPRAAWRTELAALMALALPLVFTQLAQMAVMTTDVIMLGRLSQTALAAGAIGSTVYYLAWLIGAGPPSAVAPMVAQSLGAEPDNKEAVRAIVRMGLWAVILMALPMAAVLVSGRWILLHLGQDPVLANKAGQFLDMLAVGLPFSLGFMVLRNFSAAVGKPNAALWVMLATIVFNAIADYALIFGHFGFPRLEMTGAGLATSCSSVFSFLAMLVVVSVDPVMRRYRLFHHFFKPVWSRLSEVYRLGLPIGLIMIFEAMLFNVMTLVMGTFGEVSLAAHQVALNFASVTFMVPLGIGMAATVRVGIAIGRGDAQAARLAGFAAMGVGVGFTLLSGLAMAFFGTEIASLYFGVPTSKESQAIVLAALFLKVAAAFQLVDSLQVIATLALRGLKDTRIPMFLAGGSYWLVGAPVCLLLGLGLGMQGLGIWIGLAFGLAVAAAVMCWRFEWLTRAGRMAVEAKPV
jgi:MATE family multidrug resistance protein